MSSNAQSSIWAHVAAHVPPDGPGLLPGGDVLPDDQEVDPAARSLPGSADGPRLVAGQLPFDDVAIEKVTGALQAAVVSSKPHAFDRLYELLEGTNVLEYLGAVLDAVPGFKASPDRIYDLGRRLVTESRHRAPVKVGITLFGFFESGYHVDVLRALGRHEEFTFYVIHAISRGLDDPEAVIWELARNTRGWGRIHAVRHLVVTARRPDVEAWILRHGFRNDVGDEYLARQVAERRGLAQALSAPEVDEELLHAGVDIVRALFRKDMDDFEDGARLSALVLDQLRTRASTLSHALAVHEMDVFVQSPGNWDRRAAWGWTQEMREVVHTVCADILSWPWWPDLVAAGLASTDPVIRSQAAEVATFLPPRTPLPVLDPSAWFEVVQRMDEQTVDRVVGAAIAALPLAQMASGPSGALATEPEYQCLDVVLSALVRWPGRGWPLVRTGLASPVVLTRNLALRTLHGWGRQAWPPEAEAGLRATAAREPEPEVRRRIERLLTGQPLEQAVVVRPSRTG